MGARGAHGRAEERLRVGPPALRYPASAREEGATGMCLRLRVPHDDGRVGRAILVGEVVDDVYALGART